MSYGTVQAEKVTTESGYSLGAGNASSFKNRLINGAMAIDQRNQGASVSIVGGAPKFGPDRFQADLSTSTGVAYSIQQVSDAPAGFTTSMRATVTTAGSTPASNYSYIRQSIEGYNFADLNFGTANAKSFTLSFWVKASITGTYGGYLGAALNARFQVFSFTVSAANTWEFKTVTISGDTSGAWNSTNGVGLQVAWSLSCGSSYLGSPGSWSNSLLLGATGQTNITETSGATFAITGVQLEVGTVATSFDFRSYGTELALCQRYYQHRVPTWGTARSTDNYIHSSGYFKVTMRTNPTLTQAYNTYGQTITIQDQNADYYVTGANSVASSSLGAGYNASAEL